MRVSWLNGRRGWIGGAIAAGVVAGATGMAAPSVFAADLDWTVTETPNPNGDAAFYDVEALAADDVWAVGGSYADEAPSLIGHWDGSRWTETAHPALAYLGAADATAADDVWAVGQGAEAPFDHGRTLRWDGEEWKPVPGPSLPTDFSYLTAVSALSDGTAWAGGVMTNEPNESTARQRVGFDPALAGDADWEHTGFVQHWDGNAWEVTEPTVPDGAEYVEVTQVHAVDADEVWAAGWSVDATDRYLPWLARFSDGEWANVEVPGLGTPTWGNLDGGIVATGEGDLVFAGAVYDGDTAHPLLLTWNGEKLTREDFPETDAAIDAVIATGDGDLLLTGGTGADLMTPTVLRYRDGALAAEATPEIGRAGYLAALSAVPDTDVLWTAGLTTDDVGKPTGPIAAYTA